MIVRLQLIVPYRLHSISSKWLKLFTHTVKYLLQFIVTPVTFWSWKNNDGWLSQKTNWHKQISKENQRVDNSQYKSSPSVRWEVLFIKKTQSCDIETIRNMWFDENKQWPDKFFSPKGYVAPIVYHSSIMAGYKISTYREERPTLQRNIQTLKNETIP